MDYVLSVFGASRPNVGEDQKILSKGDLVKSVDGSPQNSMVLRDSSLEGGDSAPPSFLGGGCKSSRREVNFCALCLKTEISRTFTVKIIKNDFLRCFGGTHCRAIFLDVDEAFHSEKIHQRGGRRQGRGSTSGQKRRF
jgi:hypothetical protein